MSMIRKAVASGTFYPSSPDELKDFIKKSLPTDVKPAQAKAAIMPHAGYIYSGQVAIQTAAAILPKKKLLIMGPNHTGRGEPFSVFSQGAWQTPLGNIEVDSKTSKELTQKGLLQEDYEAHRYEHSIEVQLPILKVLFNEFSFIPIVCTVSSFEIYSRVAEIIHQTLTQSPDKDEFLLIASSDMTHYEPAAQAEKKDKYTIEAILNLDTNSFLKRIAEKDVSMCGVAPVGIMLEVLKRTSAKGGRLVRYATSGDVNKDYSSVVGYAGVLFN